MRDEAALLKAIENQPRDSSPRLIYADWLEERGDPRAELVRLEEKMRTHAPFSDAYWQLKPRRNELKEDAPKDWLARLGYADVEPVFSEVPDGWRERWRLIREFTERWQGIPMADAGGPIPDTAVQQEARPDGTLDFPPIDPAMSAAWPPSVREWFAYVRHMRNIKTNAWPPQTFADRMTSAQFSFDYVGNADEVTLMSDDGHRSHYMVPRRSWKEADPAVRLFDNTSGEDGGVYRPHVTTLALSFVLECSTEMFSGSVEPDAVSFHEPIPSDLIPEVRNILKRNSLRSAKFDTMAIYEKRNLFVALGPPANEERLLVVLARGSDAAEVVGKITSII